VFKETVMHRNHPFNRPLACLISAIGSLLVPCCTTALGQNLMLPPASQVPAAKPIPALPVPETQPNTPPTSPAQGQQPAAPAAAPAASTPVYGNASEQLEGVSLFVVAAPPPKKYAKHDLVEVIVNESSVQNLAQVVDTKKDYDLTAELSKFPSLKALIESATLAQGIGNVTPGIGLKSGNKFKGDSKLSRKDQVTAKITATVVDVKPNGTLVLEARESITTDREITTMVLSGTCREEDITRNNTVQSSQLAALNMKIEHEGDVKDNAVKGLIPRMFETIFNF
jgi:flagellar L-ring protein precursor FlgH